ncbi:hypothetical protein KI387_023983, partial [Taxus chinensis]
MALSSPAKRATPGKSKPDRPVAVRKEDDEQVAVAVAVAVCKRTKSPGVRVIGGRIYDSENGKTCHQCRQKTLEFMASCKNTTIGKIEKPCTMNFCPKCLFNRYGEKVEAAAKSEDWKCPRCRGVCNCSICMKKQGCAPTGILAHAAKATGFASVSDLLQCQGLSLDRVDALTMDGLLESIHSGNTDVKDLVKKLKPVHACLISTQSVDSSSTPSNNQSVPPLINLLKDKNHKPLSKPSTYLKECKAQKSFDQSPTHIESQFEETAYLSKSSKKKNRESTVGGKNKEKSPHVLGLSDEAIITKEKTNGNSKIKVKTKREKKSDAPLCSTVTKSSSPKIKGQDMAASEDTKGSVRVVEITEPLQSQKLTTSKRKQEKTHPSKICPGAGNEMPAESNHVPDAAERKSKKRKSDDTNSTEQKDALNDCVGQVEEKRCPNKNKKKRRSYIEEEEDVLVVLPQGKSMQSVAGMDFQANDVGQALQFLEFCSAFEQVLNLNKGHPESILRELTRGRIGRRGMYSSLVQFHVKLLSLIGEDIGEQCEISHSGSGENSWVLALRRLVLKKSSPSREDLSPSSSNQPSAEWQKMRQQVCEVESFIDSSLRGGAEGYEKLNPSRKLRLLNILCDESLSTRCLRNWIDSTSTRFIECKKEHQEEAMAVRDKAREAKQRMKDEVARILLSSKEGPPLTISEHDELISRVRLEAEKAEAAKQHVLEAASRMRRQRCDAIRTEHIVQNENGQVFWRLKGGSDRLACLLQDVSSGKPLIGQDQWFVYNEEEENILAKYIRLSRAPKAGKHRRILVAPQSCNKMAESEPVCAMEIVLDEAASNA